MWGAAGIWTQDLLFTRQAVSPTKPQLLFFKKEWEFPHSISQIWTITTIVLLLVFLPKTKPSYPLESTGIQFFKQLKLSWWKPMISRSQDILYISEEEDMSYKYCVKLETNGKQKRS